MIDTIIGNYRILEKVGEGGMGAVYRAIDQMVERSVAIKVLRPEISSNPEVAERFRSEAVALARLNHASIASLYSFFREGDQYYMAMEFVAGETLEKRLRRVGKLPWNEADGILLAILEGIAHAHEAGILHRDLKPANIMLTAGGGVKVTDFGIARVLNSVRLTREARVVGTLEYLAPERALGKPAEKSSDVYSLGVVWYEMLTAKLPFEADTDIGLMRAQIEQQPKWPGEMGVVVPSGIEAVLRKALAKDPQVRYADAEAFLSDLKRALPAAAEQSGTNPQRPNRKLPTRTIAMVGAGAMAVALVVFAGAAFFHARPSQPLAQVPVTETISAPSSSNASLEPIAPPIVIPAQPASAAAPSSPSRTPAAQVALSKVALSKAALPGSPARRSAIAPPLPVHNVSEILDRPNNADVLPYAKILEALKSAGALSANAIAESVRSRGVSFRPTPDQLIELREAGANDALLQAVISSFRAGANAEPVTATPSAGVASPAPATVQPAPFQPVQALRDVHKLYVAPANQQLNDCLRQEMASQLNGRVQLVSSAEAADAFLEIDIQDQRGNRVVGTAGRLVGLKAKTKATVQIVEAHNKHVLWSAEAGDRQAVMGVFGDSARRLASRIVKQLRSDWNR